ncbi:hypothetical protein AFIC_001527 [[Pseudomonas] carboxydohydrogena]|uniref:Uncharacterized protein n=1 Tax=Afipia carboxydohydrogena TaxID=290 RepID=A0ABY8BUL9_AFICR|nr:hypothetical protein [[Pseudomonas] carboxydohydrogena]WEF53011.1 hypothetical protein AFIC_001527 [[Pseudomonas] carboxydohydrogena]
MIDRARNDISALEAAAASARAGFACMFSTSDEYERALIAERRAQGRYHQTRDWQPMFLLGCVFILSGILLVAL